MTLGESLTGVSLLHATDTVLGVTGVVAESEAGVCLALLVQANGGIEPPHAGAWGCVRIMLLGCYTDGVTG